MGLLQVLTMLMVFLALSDGFGRQPSRYGYGRRGDRRAHAVRGRGYNHRYNQGYDYDQYPGYSYSGFEEYKPYEVSEYKPYQDYYHDGYPQEQRGYGGYGGSGYQGYSKGIKPVRCDPSYANIPALLDSLRSAIILGEKTSFFPGFLESQLEGVAQAILDICSEQAGSTSASKSQMKSCYDDVLEYFKRSKFDRISCAGSVPSFHKFIEPVGYDDQITVAEVVNHLIADVHSDNFYAYMLVLFKHLDTDFDGCIGAPDDYWERLFSEFDVVFLIESSVRQILGSRDRSDAPEP